MIPGILRIKNFLSYGPQTEEINFESHQLICLTGKNGHGKSALLDAITWALWGQARKMNGVARGEEQLVHLGQDHMIVSLDFESNKSQYRVIREYSKLKGKKTLSELQFGILDKTSHEFVPKTGKTTRETQDLITKTIGLSFDGCTNSIFLRQGLSHEFSKKSPQERKEVLSAILGLSHLEEYRAKALTIIRDFNREKKQLEQNIEQLQKKIKEHSTIPQEFTTAKEYLAKTEKLLIELSETQKNKQKKLEDFQEQHNLWLVNKKEYELSQLRYHEISEQMLKNIEEWRTIRKKIIATKNNYCSPSNQEKLQKELSTIQNKKNELLIVESKLLECKNRLYLLEQEETATLAKNTKEIDEELQKLFTNKTIHEKELIRYKNEIQSYIATLEQKNREKNNTISLQNAIEKTEKEIKKLEKKLSNCLAAQKNSEGALSLLMNQKIKTEHTLKTLHSGIGFCPTCTQPVPLEKKEQLLKTYTQTLQKQSHCILRQKKRQKIAQELTTHYIKELEEKNSIYAKNQKAAQNNQNNEQECLRLTTEINNKQKLIKENESTITKISFQITHLKEQKSSKEKEIIKSYQEHPLKITLLQEQPKLKETGGELKKLLATVNEKSIIDALKKIEDSKSLQAEQEKIRQKKKNLVEQIKPLIKSIREQKKAVQILHQKITEQKEALLENNTRNELEKITQNIEEQNQIKTTLFKRISVLEVQHAALEEYRTTLQKLYSQNQALVIHLDEYQIVSNALSKNGIQALIIENVLPEIEMEANAILSRLSNNNTQIAFESIKDLKNGSSRETLDIHISDAMGIRPYELFSGGEAFRIDFSIRIALSKLLAKRSGKRLQTLIIDEGFGSQDEEGLEKILEALQKIQDDFEKIIVVSHLSEMKSQFPTNFVIEKSATGSHVTIAEQW